MSSRWFARTIRRAAVISVVILQGALLGPLALLQADEERHAASAARPVGYIDTHMHLDGRYGPSERSRGSGAGPRRPSTDYARAADALVALMDEWGVEYAVIMPPPQQPHQRGGYTYRELLTATARYPDRLALAAGGGELMPMILGTEASAVTTRIRDEFTRRAMRILDSGAKAFGEMAALHYSFHPGHPAEQVAADHPLFLLLADIAADNDVPIDLHMEAAPADQPTPAALLARSDANPAMTRATIPGLERLLAHNRKARIVWTHVGWDNTGHLTVGLLRRLLAAHPNLYCAIKFVRQTYEPFGMGNKLIQESTGALDPQWERLIRDYPDRFMVGADEFVGIPGQQHRKGPPSFEDTWRIMERLPEELCQAVGRLNAARVYRLSLQPHANELTIQEGL